MIKLLGLHYSPWTQRARWALDQCGVSYQYAEYLPGVGEPLLRLWTRKWRGPVQVPVLFVDGSVVTGSDAIARYAARVSPRLGDLAACVRWEELADAAACEGRLRVVQRSLASPRVQEESLDGTVPRLLQPAFRWLSRSVMRALANKYVALARDGSMRAALLEARAALRHAPYLLGSFSYADIALASALQMVEPVGLSQVATREAWTWAELAHEFADLLAWRAQLLSETRPGFARHVSLAA